MRWLTALTCAGMFVVLVMGAAVTNTGSAEGCGRSWPLCNGRLVPEFTVSTAIEYSHRAVTGVEGLLVVALTAAMLGFWRRHRDPTVGARGVWRRDRESTRLALLMLATLLLQAGLGAGAVLWPQSPLMLATHFGVSLVAFASTFLSAVVVFDRTSSSRRVSPAAPTVSVHPAARPIAPHQAESPAASQSSSSSRASPGGDASAAGQRPLRGWAIAVLCYVLAVVYLGAYVRHAGVSLACADWPLCNGQVVPSLEGPSAVAFAHRVAALGAVLLLGWLARLALRDGVAQFAALLAAGLGGLQALSGALVVWTRLGLFATLAHAAIMALLFACLVYVVRRAAASPERNDSVRDMFSPSDDAARALRPTEAVSFPHVLSSTSSGARTAGLHWPVVDDGGRQRAIAERAGLGPGSRDERVPGSPEQ